jgi:hypothetical protein
MLLGIEASIAKQIGETKQQLELLKKQVRLMNRYPTLAGVQEKSACLSQIALLKKTKERTI